MKKKIIMTISTVMLSLSMSLSAFAGMLTVDLNGLNRVFADSVNIEGNTYVDIDSASNQLYFNYDFNEYNNILNIFFNSNELILKVDSTTGYLNDDLIDVPNPPKIIDDTLYVPLRYISETLGYSVDYNNETSQITIDNNSVYISSLSQYDNIPEDATVYTYDEALNVANNNSISKKQLLTQYEEAERQLKLIQNQIDITPNYSIDMSMYGMDGYTYNVGSSAVKTLLSSQEAIRDSLALEGDTTQALEDGIELSLLSQLNSLTIAKINYLLADESLSLQETNLKNLELKNSLGLVSDSELESAKNSYEQTEATLNTLESSIKSANVNLNSILGIDLDSQVYVDYDLNIDENIYDEEELVSQALSDSITIKNAENSVKSAKDAFNIVYSDDSKAEKQLALDNANYVLADAKTQTEKNARDAYSQYQAILNQDKSLKSARNDAITTYNTVLASYEAGYVTLYEVELAELGIANAEANILQNQLTCNLLVFQLEHPELF